MSQAETRAAILAKHQEVTPARTPKDEKKAEQELARRRNRSKAAGFPKLNQDRFMWRRP